MGISCLWEMEGSFDDHDGFLYFLYKLKILLKQESVQCQLHINDFYHFPVSYMENSERIAD